MYQFLNSMLLNIFPNYSSPLLNQLMAQKNENRPEKLQTGLKTSLVYFTLFSFSSVASISSFLKLEIDERSYFFRHIYNDQLDYNQETDEFDDPGRLDKEELRFIRYGLRNEMKNYQSQHHHAPFRPHLEKLWNLIPIPILKYIPYNKD